MTDANCSFKTFLLLVFILVFIFDLISLIKFVYLITFLLLVFNFLRISFFAFILSSTFCSNSLIVLSISVNVILSDELNPSTVDLTRANGMGTGLLFVKGLSYVAVERFFLITNTVYSSGISALTLRTDAVSHAM